MSVAQGSTGVKQELDANDGFDGPLYQTASEFLAKQRTKTTEKVLKGARQVAKANPEHGETEPPAKSTKKKRETYRTIARRVYDEFPVPLAFFGDKFWGLDPILGWYDATDRVHRACQMITNCDASKTVIPVLNRWICVPDYAAEDANTMYWERVDGFGGRWKPVYLKKHEVLFVDGIYDALTGEILPTAGRVIFGPMVTQLINPQDEIRDEAKNLVRSGHTPQESCPEFLAMVERMFPDSGIRDFFQEMAGLVLVPHFVLRGQVILVGGPKSGKTSLATAIACAPAGRRGMGSSSEAELAGDKWAKTDLLGKFINVSDDSAHTDKWPGFVKSYTSGRLKVEFKYHTPMTCPATAKLWSTCNEMQRAEDASGAMSDRTYPFRVVGRIEDRSEDTDFMSPNYWSNLSRREGVTTWLLEGLRRFFEKGNNPQPPDSWLEVKDEAVSEADPIEGWFKANLTRGTGEITSGELDQKIPVDLKVTRGRIGMYIKRLFGTEAYRTERNGERIRVYEGLAWK